MVSTTLQAEDGNPWKNPKVNIGHRKSRKSMFPEMIQGDLCSISVSYNACRMHLWSVWMHMGDFYEVAKMMIFDDAWCMKSLYDLEESASHPSPPPWRGAPSFSSQHRTSKITKNRCSQNWSRMTYIAYLYHIMPLECIPEVSGCIWVNFMKLQKWWFLMIYDAWNPHMIWRRVLRTPPLLPGRGAPSALQIHWKTKEK